MYVFPASAYPRTNVRAGVVTLGKDALCATGLCDSSLEAGLNNLDADIVVEGNIVATNVLRF